MSDLTPELAAEIVAACTANADEIAGALGRALDAEFSVSPAEASSFANDALPEGFDGPGLIVLLRFGGAGMIAAIPESSGTLPSWCGAPDATGQNKLTTLAQELGMLLMPESHRAEAFLSQRVDSLGAAIQRGAAAEAAKLASLPIAAGNSTAQLAIVWPLTKPGDVLPAKSETAGEPTPAPQTTATSQQQRQQPKSPPSPPGELNVQRLPSYSRSLLKVQMPVHVRIAARKENVHKIVELVPGSILKFNKACSDLLDLYVGNQAVARGEAVKVGDKFGFRVTSMLLPNERFQAVRTNATASK